MYPGHLGTIRPLDTIQILYDLAVVQCATVSGSPSKDLTLSKVFLSAFIMAPAFSVKFLDIFQ